MESEGSLPFPQESATGPYLKPFEMQSTTSNLTSSRSILTLHSHLRLGLPNGFLHSVFRLNFFSIYLTCPMQITVKQNRLFSVSFSQDLQTTLSQVSTKDSKRGKKMHYSRKVLSCARKCRKCLELIQEYVKYLRLCGSYRHKTQTVRLGVH